jgi:hypothetical protein
MAILESMGVGMLSGIVSSGLSRCASLSFAKARRLSKIDSALRNDAHSSKILKKALSDFEIVVGNYHGELTEPLARFLLELERSGLVTAMAEAAILKRKSRNLEKLFIELHNRHLPVQGDQAEKLFSAISKSFSITISEMVSDKALGIVLETYHTDISERLSKIEYGITQLANTSYDENLTSAKIQDISLRISRSSVNQLRTMTIETNKGARSFDISSIYIPTKLSRRSEDEVVLRRTRQGQSVLYRVRSNDSEISYSDLVNSFQRVVVLGDPGGGKSTLCQFLCFDLAKKTVLGHQEPREKKLVPQTERVPFRIILRSFDKARTNEPQLDLLTYLERELRNFTNIPPNDIAGELRYLLTYGQAVLAFDGLDEILDPARRREFVALVTSFSDSYPLCPVIVTSRLVGYSEAPLPDEFERLTLKGFERDQVVKYVQKFFKIVGGYKKAEAEERAKDFIKQTNKNATDLRTNPLLLGIMCWLFYTRGNVPENLPEIYKECALLMFDKWDRLRGIKAEIPEDFDLLELFSVLAAKIYGDVQLEEGVSDTWLLREVREFFKGQYEDNSRAVQAARKVQEFLVGRAWIMTEIGDRVYKFTHRTFLEYFFATHLWNLHDNVRTLFNLLRPKVRKGEWEVVSHLVLQLAVYKNPRRTSEALQELAKTLEGGRSGRQKLRSLVFAAKALSYLPAPESDIRGFVRLILEKALVESHKSKSPIDIFSQVVIHCTNCCRERRTIAYSAIKDVLVEMFRSGDSRASLVAMHVIASPTAPFGVSREALDTGPDVLKYVARLPRQELKKYIRDMAKVDPGYALLAWEWYDEDISQHADSFGFTLLFLDYSLGTVVAQSAGLNGFMNLVLIAANLSPFYSAFDLPDSTSARTLLKQLGKARTEQIDASDRLLWTGYSLPAQAYEKILRSFQSDADLLYAFLVLLLMEFELHEMASSQHRKSRRSDMTRAEFSTVDLVASIVSAEARLGRKESRAGRLPLLLRDWQTKHISLFKA